MIQVRGLTKVFPAGPKAVDALDFMVRDGEIMGLLGPNGAGKTTTIRALSTLCGFDSGQVIVAGYDVDREPEKVRQNIGIVAQNTGIDYFLTGRENLELQGHLYRMKKSEIQNRIAELAHYFDLEDSLDRQVAAYSGGMRRKLDIATALIHHPKLVFLDEPTLGLDIKSRKMLWNYIEKLNKEMGITILLTTHYLEEADKLAHRVAIISGGKIRAVGTPDELKSSIAGDALSLNLEQQDWASQQFASALRQTAYVKDLLWEGNKLHLYVTHGAESVPKLTELANKYSVQILSLSLSRPSLDDVFLKYTGSSMEDSGEESGDQWWKQWAGKGSGGKWQQQWSQDPEVRGNTSAPGSEWQENQWSETAPPAASSAQQAIPPEQGQNGITQQTSAAAWPKQQWSADDMAQWESQQGHKSNIDRGSSSSPFKSDDDASDKPWPQTQQWSSPEASQWPNDQRKETGGQKENVPGDGEPADKDQPLLRQQDRPSDNAAKEWPAHKKWSGNPTKK